MMPPGKAVNSSVPAVAVAMAATVSVPSKTTPSWNGVLRVQTEEPIAAVASVVKYLPQNLLLPTAGVAMLAMVRLLPFGMDK